VITIGAMDSKAGAMFFTIEEAQTAIAMIEQSQSLTVIVDKSKFDQIASFKVCELNQIDRLVCDELPTGDLDKALKNAGVDLILAKTQKLAGQ